MGIRAKPLVLCALLLNATLVGAFLPAASGYPVAAPTAWPRISVAGNITQDAVVAFTPNGTAVAAWSDYTSTDLILAAWYRPGTGWSAPAVVRTGSTGLYELRIAVDSASRVTLIWHEFSSTVSLYYSQAPAGGAWSAPKLLRTGAGFIDPPLAFAANPAGGAFAFWTEYNSGQYRGWAAAIDASGNHTTPTRIDSNVGSLGPITVVAEPSAGQAAALWCNVSGPVASLSYSRYTPGGGWASAATLAYNVSSTCGMMAAGIDGAGDVTVLYYGDRQGTLLETHGTFGGSWSNHSMLADPPNYLTGLELGVDADGTASAAWKVGDPYYSIPTSLYVSSRDANGVWEAPLRYLDNISDGAAFALATAPEGGALLSYHLGDSPATYYLAVHPGLAGCSDWSGGTNASVPNPYPNWGKPAVAMGPAGEGVILAYSVGTSVAEIRAGVFTVRPQQTVITSPAPGSNATSSLVSLEGRAAPNSTVSVGSTSTTAAANGSFKVSAHLEIGDNNVTVRTDYAGAWSGCSSSLRIQLHLDDPIPGLEAAVALAFEEIGRLWAELNFTKANVSTLQSEVAVASAELSATQTQLAAALAAGSATQAQLNSTVAQLATTQADLAAQVSRADALEAQANQTRSDLETAQGLLDQTIADLATEAALLNDSRAEAAATRAQLDATAFELERTKAQLPWLEANLTVALTGLTAANARAVELSARLNDTQIQLSASQQREAQTEEHLNGTDARLQDALNQNAALSSQVATLSLLTGISLMAAVAGIALQMVITRRAGGSAKKEETAGGAPSAENPGRKP